MESLRSIADELDELIQEREQGETGAYCGVAWFAPFGFAEGMAEPDTGAQADPVADGLVLVGTVDTVTRQLERLLARLPARWLFAWTYNGLIPHRPLMRSIETFATEVLPRVGGEEVAGRSSLVLFSTSDHRLSDVVPVYSAPSDRRGSARAFRARAARRRREASRTATG